MEREHAAAPGNCQMPFPRTPNVIPPVPNLLCANCRLDKEREHAAALEVLPDLLNELDQTPPKARLTSLVEGILAGNIFDWGAKATVDLYYNGTILEIYRYGKWQVIRS